MKLPSLYQCLTRAGYETCYVGKWHSYGRPALWGVSECLGLFGPGRRPSRPARDSLGRLVTGYVGWRFQTAEGKPLPDSPVGLVPGISAKFADAAISFIRRSHDRPFLLHVNFTAPHDPLYWPPGLKDAYSPDQVKLPANFLPVHPFEHGNFFGRDERLLPWPRTKHLVAENLALYYSVVTYLDSQIGRILRALQGTGLASSTVVIFTSDNGLALGCHGLMGKQNMYEHTINVPLIISGPGIAQGVRTSSQCYLRDLYPTICQLAGAPVPAHVEARSLLPVLKRPDKELYPFVIGYYRNFQRMIRTSRWKLIWYPHLDKEQLFDVSNDPYEMKDLRHEERFNLIAATLRAQMVDWLKAHGDPLFRPVKCGR